MLHNVRLNLVYEHVEIEPDTNKDIPAVAAAVKNPKWSICILPTRD